MNMYRIRLVRIHGGKWLLDSGREKAKTRREEKCVDEHLFELRQQNDKDGKEVSFRLTSFSFEKLFFIEEIRNRHATRTKQFVDEMCQNEFLRRR